MSTQAENEAFARLVVAIELKLNTEPIHRRRVRVSEKDEGRQRLRPSATQDVTLGLTNYQVSVRNS